MAAYKMNVVFVWGANIMENVFYFDNSVDVLADVRAAANNWATLMYATIGGLITDQVNGDHMDLYLWEGTDWILQSTDPYVFGGESISNPLPRQSAAVLIGRTATPRVQGRKFIGGLTENFQNGGVLDGVSTTALGGFADVWTDSPFIAAGVSIYPGVWHKASSEVIRFIGNRVDRFMGTQRRRKQGVGI